MFHVRRHLVAPLCATLTLLVVFTPAAAEGVGDDVEVVVTGLDNPRGITVDSRGHLWVAEAGRGGPDLVDTPLGDSEGPVCVGNTGAVTRIVRGEARRLIANLPSVAEAVEGQCGGPGFGIAATGPHGVAAARSGIAYSIGLGGIPAARDLLAAATPEASLLGTVELRRNSKFGPEDLAAFELGADPDQEGPDSNPYGLEQSGRAVIATDAGGNTLLRLERDGTTSVLAVFAPRCIPFALGPNPIPPEANPCGDDALFPASAVPTDVVQDRSGNYLVTTLGGFPFAPGYSRVWKVDRRHSGPAICSTFAPVPGDGCEVFADGLTALVGIDIDQKGNVYVVQMTDTGILTLEAGGPGSVQVLHPRSGEVIGSIDGLMAPGGVAVSHKNVYVTTGSIFPGAGGVVRTGTF